MMAGLRSVCLLLEKHRDVICEDVNVDEVVPDLVAKGILNTEDKKALAAETSDRTKGELLVSLLGKKGFAAFQEFCHVLEKSHPHLITCFLMDFAAGGVTPSVTSGGDTESQYSLDSATREQHRIRGSHDSASLYGTLSRRRSSVRRNRSMATPPPPSEPPDPDSGPSVYSDPGGSGTLPSGSTVGSVSESSEPHLTEVLEEPVTEEPGGERVVWEFHQVSLNRVPGYGFGIAVSGGRDNPHFTTGDPSIAISDVLKAGPAEGKLHVNDRVLSANGISLENVDYGTAVQVLKDSGAVVHLYVKRRVVLPASLEPQTYKLVLNKAKKKDDFGIVLGCHIYVKEISGRTASSSEGEAGGLQEGDTVLRINHMSTDGLTLKEARKLLDTTKDRLGLTVRRDPAVAAAAAAKNQRLAEGKLSPPRGVHQEERNNYSNQNLYVQPPTRGSDRSDYGRIQPQSHQQPSRHGQLTNGDDKNNLIRQNGRGRGPLMEVSLSQLDQPATPLMRNHLTPGSEELPPPPRPPVPRDNINGAPMTNGVNGHHPTYSSDYGEMSKSNYDHSPKSKANVPDPRFVSFQKDGSVGIRLAGGNETGIFVTAVQSGSPAALQGLQPGDKIIKVNGMEMKGVTREEAVLFLLSLQDQIDLIVQHRKDEHDEIIASQRGDSFYIRTHFNHEQTGKNELSFRKGDIFHVVDTLNMGVVGAWQVFRIGRNNEETQKGVVPNKSRAEELATAQFNAAKKVQSTTETRSRFFSRRRRQGRSKSLGKDHWEDVVFSDAVSKFPAYERVALRGCSFVRPVVLFGGVSDLARDQLLKDMPDKFAAPHLPDLGVLRFHDNYIKLDMADDSRTSKHSGIIRLSAIRELVELGRHALLDVTPNAVDRLNYAQLYPICIFLRAESKHIIKEVRTARAAEKPQQKSSKKMFDQCVKLEKLWSHVFTASITMTDADGWYRRIRELIDKQQNAPIWMSETKPGESLSDDYLFPMTSRLSFVSSPESDVEGTETSPTRSPASSAAAATSSSGSCDQLQQPRLGRSSSDPSLAPEDLMQAPGPPPYSPYSQQQQPQGLHDEGLGRSAAGTGSGGGKRGSHGSDSRYGFSPTRYPADADDYPSLPVSATSKHHPHPAPSSPRSPYQTLPHDFRPNGVVQQHPAHSQHHSPPSVDRTSKPVSPGGHGGTRSYGRASGGQMRNYMVNGGGAPEDNYMNTVVNGNGSGNGNYAPASERHRGGPYDGSPTSYDSYQRFNNMHDDLKARSLPPQELLLASAADGTAGPPQQLPLTNGSAASGRSHDPYRFTRSTAQPSAPTAGDATVAQPSQTHRSYSGRFELKPPPPPKNSVSLQSHLQQYKPIPPPKPKGFRGPPASASDSYRRPADSRRTPDSRGSREDFAGFLATNGGVEDGGGFDSGHGSSLDRNGESQRTYMNMKPAPPGSQTHYLNMPPTSSSKDPLLDLSNRDQRGSAFELYKKPHIESRYPSAAYNVEHAAGASVHSSSVPPESPWACLSPRRRSALRSLSSCSSSPRRRRGSLPTEPSSAPFLDLPTSPPSSPSRQQATARGVFTHEGGVLHDPHTRVSILIPPGAIPPGRAQEIYFNVCSDNSYLPPLDTRKGETLLSPLVMCGPQGLHFDIPVQLQLPHCAAVDPDSWSFALKSTADGGRSDAWRKMRLSADGSTSRVEADCVSVLVDHF